MTAKRSIYIEPSHKGELHRDLGVPDGQKLTDDDIARGLASKDPAVRMRARFAKNAKKFNHGGAA